MSSFPQAMIDYRELSALERDDLMDIAEAMNDQGKSQGARMPSLFDQPLSRN